MRTVSTLTVLVCAGMIAQAGDEKFTSKEGKFTIHFPPDAAVKIESKKVGNIDINSAIVSANGHTHIAMYMDLPATVKDVPAKTILDGAEKNCLANGGRLENAKDIEFGQNKVPGRELVLDKEGHKVKTRILVVGTRVYVLVVGGPKDFATSHGTKFFDSFELTK